MSLRPSLVQGFVGKPASTLPFQSVKGLLPAIYGLLKISRCFLVDVYQLWFGIFERGEVPLYKSMLVFVFEWTSFLIFVVGIP